MAVRVGIERGSIVVRFRPVGNTSALPRLGAPAGPGLTRRPSSAARSACCSFMALLRTAASICSRRSPVTEVPAAARIASTSVDCASRSGARPKTWSRSRILSSLMSHRCASSFTIASLAGSSFERLHSAARPVVQAVSMIALSSKPSRRRSRPSASAYSSTNASSSAIAPCNPAALSGGVR